MRKESTLLSSRAIKIKVLLVSLLSFLLVKLLSWKLVVKLLDGHKIRQESASNLVELALESQEYLNNFVWSKNCLVRSVTLYYVFKPYLPELKLLIGSLKDSNQSVADDKDFYAHAWLENQGVSWDVRSSAFLELTSVK